MHRLALAALPAGKLEEMASLYRFPNPEEFLAAIGYGDISSHTVVVRMALVPIDGGDDLRSIPLIPSIRPTPRILVRGEKGVLSKIAPCCQPVPGDAIAGYTTRGRGGTVHRADC